MFRCSNLEQVAGVMEYTFTNAPTSDGHTQYKANVKQPGAAAPQPLTYEQAVLELKKEEQGGPLTIAMTQLLANSPYPAVVMELPCATKAAVSAQFEFVLINCPELSDPNMVSEVPAPFQAELGVQDGRSVVHFIHGGSAIIIAPKPLNGVDPKTYVDLKRFAQAAISAGATSELCKQFFLFLSQMGADIHQNGVSSDTMFFTRTPSDIKFVHFQCRNAADGFRHAPYTQPATQQAPVAAAGAPQVSFGGLPASSSFPPSTSSHKRSADGPGGQQQAPQQPGLSSLFGTTPLTTQQPATAGGAPTALGGLAGAGSTLFGAPAPAPAASTTAPSTTAAPAPAPSLFAAPATGAASAFGATTTTTDTSKPLVPGGLPAPALGGAATTTPSTLQPQAQQPPAGEAPHSSLNLQGTEEGRRFQAEFAKASLKAVHEELMSRYHADVATFEWQQAALLEGEQALQEARAIALHHEALFFQAKSKWEAVEHEMSALEGKLNDLYEHDLPEAEAYASTIGGGGADHGASAGGMMGGGRLLLAHHHHHHLDDNQVERVQLWKAVLKVEQRLTRLRTMVHDLSERVSLQLERNLSEDGPASMMVRILNAHQQSMEWAQRSALTLEHEARALEWQMRTSARLPVATDVPPSTASTFLTPGGVTYQPPPLPPSTTTGLPALPPSTASGGGGGLGGGGGFSFQSVGR